MDAPARTFQTVAGVLLAFANYRRGREGLAISFEPGRAARSEEAREIDEGTYVNIVSCLTRHAPEDMEEEPLREEDVTDLTAFYEVWGGEYASTAEQDRARDRLARSWARRTGCRHLDPRGALCRAMRETRNRLRRRFHARGLLATEP